MLRGHQHFFPQSAVSGASLVLARWGMPHSPSMCSQATLHHSACIFTLPSRESSKQSRLQLHHGVLHDLAGPSVASSPGDSRQAAVVCFSTGPISIGS